MSTHRSGRTIFKFIILSLVALFIAGYSFYQARNLINGPQIAIDGPANGITVLNALVDIKGNAKNVSFISLNGRQIFVDNKGVFNEQLLLSPGYNLWKIEARDKFGRVISKKIELVLSNS